MAEPRSRQLLLVKLETTYGTDPTPAAASDALLAVDPEIRSLADILERRPTSTSMGILPGAVGQRWCEVSFGVEIRGQGAAGSAPRGIGAALQACAMAETINVAVSAVYTPVSATASLKSVTIYAFLAGRRHIISGCVGSVEIDLTAGQHGMLRFTMMGVYLTPTTVTAPTGTFDTPLPPVVLSANFTWNAITSLKVRRLQLNLQNQIAKRDSINAASGIAGFQVTDRTPIGSFDPEQEALGTYDPFTDWIAGTARALQATVGSAAGNRLIIDAPKATYRQVGHGDRNGLLIYEHEIALGKNAGDDEITLTFN